MPTPEDIWNAAQNGQYPDTMTPEILANCKSNKGFTALHTAALYGRFPAGTTIEHLVNCKTQTGHSALHTAAGNGHLLPGITTKILQTTINDIGQTAWDCLAFFYTNHNLPQLGIIQEPTFPGDTEIAILVVNSIVHQMPELRSTAVIWLAKILNQNESPSPSIMATCP